MSIDVERRRQVSASLTRRMPQEPPCSLLPTHSPCAQNPHAEQRDCHICSWRWQAVLDIYRVHYFRKLTQHPPKKPKVGNMWEIPLPKSPKQMSHFCSTITDMRSTRRDAPPRHCVYTVVRNHTTTQDSRTRLFRIISRFLFQQAAWLQQPGREVAQAGCPIHEDRGLLGGVIQTSRSTCRRDSL